MTDGDGARPSAGVNQPASRLAAELAHSTSVKRADVQLPYRVRLLVTDDGLSRTQLKTIRKYGWGLSGFNMGTNGVSIVRQDRLDYAGGSND